MKLLWMTALTLQALSLFLVSGSGVLIDDQKYVMAAAHVVRVAGLLIVKFVDGSACETSSRPITDCE